MTGDTEQLAFCDRTGHVFDAGRYTCRCGVSHVAPAFRVFTDERDRPAASAKPQEPER